jgi:hypothetical protein
MASPQQANDVHLGFPRNITFVGELGLYDGAKQWLFDLN